MIRVPVRRALISVADKGGLVRLASRLAEHGVELVSSGGTAQALVDAGLPVTTVSQVTGAPEMLGGRVKTLHPAIHGAILARPDRQDDRTELEERGISPFQLVVVNLYPFRETAASPGATEEEVIEMIDIGGPALVRAAAKNHAHVGVVTSPEQYETVAAEVEAGGLGPDLRKDLAVEAFFHTAAYDAAIVAWLGRDLVIPLRRHSSLRYGENPHQEAALFREEGTRPWWAEARLLQGKEMSFNNYADAEAAWRLAADVPGGVVIVKHTNPCGAAYGGDPAANFERAWDCDPLSAFGGVVAFNGTLDGAAARSLEGRFVEVVLAAGLDQAARDTLAAKPAMRLITAPPPRWEDLDLRRVESGLLAQRRDIVDNDDWKPMTAREPDPEMLEQLRFAWVVAAHAKSNSVVVVKDRAAVGVGAGDQSRVGAAQRALVRAGKRARGGVAASDAFFPFRDGIDVLADAGVAAVVAPGGSRNDAEVVAAAEEKGLVLIFAGTRHFRH